MENVRKLVLSASKVQILIRVLWISIFALATGLFAQVFIPLPFTPVPITLQTVAVMASGVVLGRDGIFAMTLYLIMGGIGIPFFAEGSAGAQPLFGATGGYLLGFIAASAITSRWLRPIWDRLSVWGRGWRLFIASMMIFIPGVVQLALVTGVSLERALVLGFFPFLLGDIVKCALVAMTPSKWLRN